MKGQLVSKILIHTLLIFFCIIILLPFYWMLVSSLRHRGDFYAVITSIFPQNITFENFAILFHDTLFPVWLTNSFIVSILSILFGVFTCAAAGFAFAVYRFRFRNLLFWTVLGTVAIPEVVTIIPVFRIMIRLGLIDTYASLILPFAVSMFGIFLLKQFIETAFPMDLLEAARIDGLTEYGIFFKIVLPLIKPGLGVLAIFLWINSWSSYFWPLIMIRSRDMMTLPLGLATLYADPWNLEYGALMAGNLISTIPIMVVFLVAQEQFIMGLTTGAVKG